MSEDLDHYSQLLDAYLAGGASDQEVHELLDYIRDFPHASEKILESRSEHSLLELMDRPGANEPLDPTLSDRMLVRLMAGIHAAPVVGINDGKRVMRRWVGWAAAVVFLLAGGGSAYYWAISGRPQVPSIATRQFKGDVQPGHSGAVLQLSNGSTVVLDTVQDGTVATQGTVRAVKVNGALKYVGKDGEGMYNTISTARGRQWQLILADGTKVWLNAASSIRYPLAFTGHERTVEITGEAYFEVAHNERQPFRVKVGTSVIEDIGTSFNVNAYIDEPAMKTTLVEGAIRVISGEPNERQTKVVLKPGQQALVAGGRISAGTGDLDQALAWKNGVFSFEKADLQTVMRQLSRWYDVSVKFEGVPDATPFQGEIGRGLTLAQVLKVLEQVHVHFRIEEDKRIVILP